jgi:hypothetical protein
MDSIIDVLQFQHSAIPPCAFFQIALLFYQFFSQKAMRLAILMDILSENGGFICRICHNGTRGRPAAYDEGEDRTPPKSCFARRGLWRVLVTFAGAKRRNGAFYATAGAQYIRLPSI